MRITRSQRYPFSEHIQQVEALLDPIRSDRSIDDAERRRLIDEVVAAANARALRRRAARLQAVEATSSSHELKAHRWQRELARVG